LEDRIQYLKDNTSNLSTEHDPHAQHKSTPDIIQHLADHGDPTKKKIYTQYLTNLYKSGGMKQEDTDRAKDVLSNFDKYKTKLSGDAKQLTVKQYPSLTHIETAVEPHVGTAVTNKEKSVEVKAKAETGNLPGHELKYEDENIKIFHLKDADTSKKLYASKNDKTPGAIHPTEWCTARDTSNNMFDRYNSDGPLHVVHRKSDGAVFQYHSHSNQFMDHKDNEISHADFKTIAPSLHKAWREQPDLV